MVVKKMRKSNVGKFYVVFILFLLLTTTSFSAGSLSLKMEKDDDPLRSVEQKTQYSQMKEFEDSITQTFRFNPPVIDKKTLNDVSYDSIVMGDMHYDNVPGNPVLPYHVVSILLKKDYELDSIDVSFNEKKLLESSYYIKPGQAVMPTMINTLQDEKDSESHGFFTEPNLDVYASSERYPKEIIHDVQLHIQKGYRILQYKLYPLSLIPSCGSLYFYSDISVTIHTKPVKTSGFETYRGLQKDYGHMQELFKESKALSSYAVGNEKRFENYEYVIITVNEFQQAFEMLSDWKMNRALSTSFENINSKVVLIEEITSNPEYWWDGFWGDGHAYFNDTQCQIRNFIKMAYTTWGTDYVLLGGDADVNNPLSIPHRGVYSSVNGGVYIDDNIPCDMYYGCLDGNWDLNMNGLFGEDYPDEADLFAEVYIGRAPVDSVAQAQHFVFKTIYYEQAVSNNDDYLKDAFMIGSTLDSSTEGGNSKDVVASHIPQFTTTKAYHRDGTYSTSFILDEMQNGSHVINHAGHANVGIFSDNIQRNDISGLTNDEYFFVYTMGCYSGSFDNRNIYGTYEEDDCVGELFVTNPSGAFAFIGNSRYGWYIPGTVLGAGDKYDASFFSIVADEMMSLGKLLAFSKENLLINQGYIFRWTYYALNLLGDPETPLKNTFSSPTSDIQNTNELLITPPTYTGFFEIVGIADKGDGAESTFSHYSIEYGQGIHPNSWLSEGITLVNNGEQPVDDGLLGVWDTSVVTDATYTIKLTVFDIQGNSSTDLLVVFVKNTKLYSPKDNDFFRAGESIDIIGYVNASTFEYYTVEYGVGKNPSSWSTQGISLTNNGVEPVFDDVIAVWDTSGITTNNYFTIRVQVFCSGFVNVEIVTIVLDPDFKQGWPVRLDQRITSQNIAVGDMSGDGFKQLFVRSLNYPSTCGGFYHGFNYDGTQLQGWPNNICKNNPTHTAAMGDLTGDGQLEIIATNKLFIFAWCYDGSMVEGWPVQVNNNHGVFISSVTLEDIDNNGDLEILIVTSTNVLYVLNNMGEFYSDSFPLQLNMGNIVDCSIAVGDVNGDMNAEIVVTSSSGYVGVINRFGSFLDGWPLYLDDEISSSAVLADFNDDKMLEIVVSGRNYLHVLQHNGMYFENWPIQHKGMYQRSMDTIAIADLQNDGSLEIIVKGWSTQPGYSWTLSVFKDNGVLIDGVWPLYFPLDSIQHRSVAIGDITGDGVKEILLAYGRDTFHAWHHDGSVVQGWPKIKPKTTTGLQNYCSPVLADIDGDNRIEIILADEDHILVWELDEQCVASDVEWGCYRHDRYNTGNYERGGDETIFFVNSSFNESIPGFNITRFTSIQASITAAFSNVSIHVSRGVYIENIVIDKPVKLNALHANVTIVASDASLPTVSILSDYVSIQGFNITGATQDTGVGMLLDNVSFCLITGNIISGNSLGLQSNELCVNNLIYNNLFSNELNVFDSGQNIWNISKQLGSTIVGGVMLGGNCFSDYTGIDSTFDGIGDSPYNITGGNNIDYYPLMQPWVFFKPEHVFVDAQYNANTVGWGYTHFNSIQQGIYGVQENGTVFVYAGVYEESIDIEKSMKLSGESKHTTIISGVADKNYAVFVEADYVDLSEFTVDTLSMGYANAIHFQSSRYASISDIIIADTGNGIFLSLCSDILIFNSSINHNSGHGSHILNSNNITFKGNSFYSNNFGIYLQSSQHSLVLGNLIQNNTIHGIRLFDSNHHLLINNTLSENNNAIYLQNGCNFNIVANNTVVNNTGYGLFISSAVNNLFYNNYFDNVNNVFYPSNEMNSWNIEKTAGVNIVGGPYLGGNYWSDYNGVDNDADGLGDTPHVINVYNNKDNHPLIKQPVELSFTLNFENGWNLISFPVEFDDMSLAGIMQPLIDTGMIEIIKDGGTGVLWPAYGIDTIGNMNVTKGYNVKVNQDCMLEVTGLPVELPVSVLLHEGWNLMGYSSFESCDALSVIQPLIDDDILIQMVDSSDSRIYFNGSEWVNEIGDFQPGQGYLIKVFNDYLLEIDL
jgi:parallel beta-helix repeat protein